MARCLTSQKQREILWLVAGGKCQMCGRPLPDDWHADHIIPWSILQDTNLFKMQALCPDCNRRKGCKMTLQAKCDFAEKLLNQMEMSGDCRRFQTELCRLMSGVARAIGGANWPALAKPGFPALEVCPGGGKSYCGVGMSSVFIGSTVFDCGLWVTPRKSLCQQAKDDFVARDFRLPTGRTYNPFNPAGIRAELLGKRAEKLFSQQDCKVWITSYQNLVHKADIILQWVQSRRVFCIWDEFQLLYDLPEFRDTLDDGDGNSWNDRIDPIAKACLEKTGFGGLILSGGLYRNDGLEVPSVAYRHGDPTSGEDEKRRYPNPDIRYTLAQAQEDQTIIRIDFDLYEGKLEFMSHGESLFEDVSNLSEKQYGSKLRYFLDQEPLWTWVLYDMIDSLEQYNHELNYNSRYLVIASRIEDGIRYKDWLESKGRRPLLVHSKDKESHRNLDKFRRHQCDSDGLVTIGMAYIGLNNKDFSHLGYLSDIRSMAWINQAFHRITRFDKKGPPYEKQFARISAPNDPRMKEIRDLIMNSQSPGVLKREMPPRRPPGVCTHNTPSDFEGVDTTDLRRIFNTNGKAVEKSDRVDSLAREFPPLNSWTRKEVERMLEYVKEQERYHA
jgi:hypothetical protein